MLDRIEDLVETNRQVSDNVAHDVQTQLTRKQGGRLERTYNRQLDVSQYHGLIGEVMDLDEIMRNSSSLLRITLIR